MKKTQNPKTTLDADEIPEEIDFNYSKARPNRFAERYKESNPLVVLLDPDVAEVFTTPEAVNKALRALILTSRQLLDSETLNPSFVNEKKGDYSP